MRYIVTGGLGVVGSRFAETVLRSGSQVTIVDSAEEPRNVWMELYLKNKYQNLHIMKQRVEHTDFSLLLRTHDFMLHAAAHTGIPHSEQDPSDDWMSNVDATRHILESMRIAKSQIPTVMLSSVKPYRVHDLPRTFDKERTYLSHPHEAGIDETCLLEPDEPYAASKMAQTALVMAYGRSYDLPVTVLRCSNLYGDAPCHGPRHGWLTWFCISAAMGWPIDLQGSGRQTRDMLFSDDVATAALAGFDNIEALRGNVYNIGGGNINSLSCIQAVRRITTMIGKDVPVTYSGGRRNEDMIFVTNHEKFTNVTNWKPSVYVDDGVRRILNWALNNQTDLDEMYRGIK